jgi:hypothetical protein
MSAECDRSIRVIGMRFARLHDPAGLVASSALSHL